MKLQQIAEGINAHLKRFEADPVINRCDPEKRGGLQPFYDASAYASSRYVGVRYVSFQYLSHLTKTEARAYLDWLEAGNVGTHRDALRTR